MKVVNPKTVAPYIVIAVGDIFLWRKIPGWTSDLDVFDLYMEPPLLGESSQLLS